MQWQSLAIPVERKLPVVELWLGFLGHDWPAMLIRRSVRPGRVGPVRGFCELVFLLEILDWSQGKRLALEMALRSVVEKCLPEFQDSPPAIPVEWIVLGE